MMPVGSMVLAVSCQPSPCAIWIEVVYALAVGSLFYGPSFSCSCVTSVGGERKLRALRAMRPIRLSWNRLVDDDAPDHGSVGASALMVESGLWLAQERLALLQHSVEAQSLNQPQVASALFLCPLSPIRFSRAVAPPRHMRLRWE